MIFRRKAKQPASPWPSQGIAFRLGQWIGGLSNTMSQWPRMARASIVFIGMALAIVLFWTGHAGWAVAAGGVALVVFWLAITPTAAQQAQQDGIELLPPEE